MKILNELDQKKLDSAFAFTSAYKDSINEPPAIREAICLDKQYPATCLKILDYHIFAGRRLYLPLVGFYSEMGSNHELAALTDKPKKYKGTYHTMSGFSESSTPFISSSQNTNLTSLNLDDDKFMKKHLGCSSSGFCHDYLRLKKLAAKFPDNSKEKHEIEEMIQFWNLESMRSKYNNAVPEEIKKHIFNTTGFDTRYVSGFFRMDCYSLDYDILLTRGIPGLKQKISDAMDSAKDNKNYYKAMLMSLDVLVNVINYYKDMAENMAENCPNHDRQKELKTMAEVLSNISVQKPQTLREAIQLYWLYNLLADTPNYGRVDIYFGDFYKNDIENGRITEEEALRLLKGLWQIISEIRKEDGPTRPNARMVIGGKGRRNEENADMFSMVAMQATYEMKTAEPNLTLRFYKGQNEKLYSKALELIGNGNVHPMLYNDDVHIPLAQNAFNASYEDAVHYTPEGCGELSLNGRAIGSPNNIINFVSGLDLVLHNGYDTQTEEMRGLSLGDLDYFDTFEKLKEAFKKQIIYSYEMLAKRHVIEHEVEAGNAGYLFMSMLTHNCIESGKSIFAGGAKYLGGIIESFGMTNLVNSLAAIKHLVYDTGQLSLSELVNILDVNFEGYEKEHQMMLYCPKFGNDDNYVDDIYQEMSEFLNTAASEAGRKNGLDYFLICNLNPGGLYYAPYTKASADGRRMGDPMAMGNNPTAGTDTNSITALFNSFCKMEKYTHGGYVHNLKTSRNLFQGESRIKLEALLQAYYEKNGCQIMITVLNKEDLLDAVDHPEKHSNLLVRICGWTARFVELNKKYQQEVINRTLYV